MVARPGDGALALAFIVGLALASATGSARAQDDAFPSRPIRVVLGAPAGSGIDVVMRLLALHMQADLRQPVVVDPRPGAEGIIAAELVARAPADGYTVLVATHTQLVANVVLRRDLTYDVERDFTPVTRLTDHHVVLAAHPAFPAKTLAELRGLATQRDVDVGVPSATFEIAARRIAATMNVPLRSVPYNHMTAAYQAVLAGQVPLAVLDASVAIEAVRGGRLRALAIGARERVAVLPDVPTFAEAGYPGLDAPIWIALVAPAGVRPATLDRLRSAAHRALADSEVRARLNTLAGEPRPTTGAELAESIRVDQAAFRRDATRAGMIRE